MPYLYPLNRRRFLKVMAGGVAAVMVTGFVSPFGGGRKEVFRLALMSDTHVPEDPENAYRGFFPYRNLREGVRQVREAAPDLLVVTGDLARLEGHPGDYRTMRDLLVPLASKVPVAMALGNHDVRENFLKAFPDGPGDRMPVRGKYVLVIEHPMMRLVLLDSLVFTNLAPALGLLGKAQREWLEGFLRDHTDKPVFLFLHHTLDDSDGSLADADRFLRIVTPSRHVKAVFYGHSHVYSIQQQEGLHLVNLPAMGYNFREKDPVGWVEAGLSARGARLTLHTVAGSHARNGEEIQLNWRN